VSTTEFKLYKKLTNELKFRYSELEYVEQEIAENLLPFEEYYRSFCKELGVSISDLEEKNRKKVEKLFGNKPVPKDTEQNSERVEVVKDDTVTKKRKSFQSIYRQIAKKIHPDKFSNQQKTLDIIEKEEMFKKATYAYENDKWGMLLEIAEELDIHPTKYTKINQILRDEISDVNKQITDKQKTYSWMFSQAEEEGEKANVIYAFLKDVFDFVI
tara:strand:+ start:629 stop:1270 length:642 start_codon:yes stop_codon:yes gene_type:complete